MTNPFEPPQKRALSDADLAEALANAQQSEDGALGAMALLEEQSVLRAQDAENYVRWVRQMETDGSAEARAALGQARLSNSGVNAPEESTPASEVTEDSWKLLVPDWQERQESIAQAKEQAIEEAKLRAQQEAEREIEAAVAEAVAEAEFEAELRREEAVAAAKAAAEQAAAEILAEELRRAEELAAEQAEQARLEAERIAEEQRIEQERIHAEELAEQQRLEAEELAERERREAEQLAELEREELIRAELEAAEQAAADALAVASAEAEAKAAELAAELEAMQVVEEVEEVVEPEPVRASDFATGSFDIIESVEQAATEEFDNENFDVLLEDGELGFAREPKSQLSDKPISTIERRAKPISQLFVWSSITVGILPLLLGFISLRFDLSVIERITAVAAGFAISAALIAVVAIAGKRSGLSTLFLSRSAFGVRANLLPAILQIASKFVLGTLGLIAVVAFFSGNIQGVPAFSETAFALSNLNFNWLFVVAAAALLVSSILALLGGKALYWVQLSVASIAALTTLLFIGFSAGSINLPAAAFEFSSNWLTLVGLTAAIASLFGAFWVGSVADFTRKISMGEPGKWVALFVALAAGVLPFAITTYSLLLSGSLSGQLKVAAAANPLGALLGYAPDWLASVLLVSAVLSLLAITSNWMYSTSVSLSAISRGLRRYISQPIVLVVSLGAVVAATSLSSIFADATVSALASMAAVVIFAWAGIFVADIALRKIAYHEVSLTRDYGFYKAVNWTNLIAFLVSVALGLGFIESSATGFEFLGYLARLTMAEDWANANIGIFISLGFCLLFPILFGRKRIAGQEAEVLKIESRRNDLDGLNIGEDI